MPNARYVPLLLALAACARDVAPDLPELSLAAYNGPAGMADSGAVPDSAVDAPDVSVADGAVDMAGTATRCASANGFGCPCQTNGDCDSLLCIDGDSGKVCTAVCAGSCPTGWQCLQAPSGDPTFICVPAFSKLCMPCNDHKDCQTPGVTDSYCVPFVDGTTTTQASVNGHFCMAACVPVAGADGAILYTCETGYHCHSLHLFGSATPAVKQCLPDSGECSCHDAWAQAGKSTECHKTSFFGTCTSTRQCQVDASGAATLTTCDAPMPATESCGDAIDNDCNGQTDEPGSVGCTNWYLDNDGDGFGFGLASAQNCRCVNPGPGYSTNGGDCNDFATSIRPGQPEICNNIDDNCNGQTDEAGAKGCTLFYHDADGDGFGNPNDSACMCKSKATSAWILQGADCNDTAKAVHPGATETCDGIDNNCNGKTDEDGCP